ncbi:Thioredoxin-like fold protein [Ascosphaera apis ARSEF 7405]|uniref:Thioredoxin-like fold protein n=1 Tax=Ascosphaera apis ARSEF 7405 TaxID=392613 RepID=A0A168DZD5_9EURO|nr:Thioredoxin-like fold protein [Ascosphaera apis ARSEF 7405]
MKLLSLLLPLLATTQVLAQDTQDTQNQEKTNVPDEKKQLEQANIKLDDAPHATTFNSIDVPPIPELTSQNFDDTIKEGFWFIKYYSPYCPFCVSIIPTWQTLYELYTTSKPTTPSTQDESLNTFTDYYNFRFASLNCVEYADKCLDQGITMWPTFALYNNSQLVTYYYEKKDMEGLSQFLEEKLNVIRPDSRPAAGTIKLPEPGANSSDPLAYNITSTETLAANASDEIMDDLTQKTRHYHI